MTVTSAATRPVRDVGRHREEAAAAAAAAAASARTAAAAAVGGWRSNSGQGPLFVLEIRGETDQLNIK